MKKIIYLLIVVAIMPLSIYKVYAAPAAETLEFWNLSDENSETVVSHLQWQKILDTYLRSDTDSGVNLFAYQAVTKADKKKLKAYLETLQALDPRQLNRQEQLSYWINFYNALTIDVVLDEYPVKSIKDIRFLTSLFGPWDKNLVKVKGQKLSLNDIEHGILRPIWKDPRIHFVVNCASIGCPNLHAQAFTSENTERLMEMSAEEFINHPRGVSIDSGRVVLSSIFDWYGSDFGSNQAELIEYLAEYYEGSDVEHLEAVKEVEFAYNWQLNQAVK